MPMRCRAGRVSRARSIAAAAPATALLNFSRRCPGEARAELLLQLALQLAHECRQTGTAFALQPLGLEDRLHLGERRVDVVIDHDIIVFGPMAHLVTGAAHPST